MIALALASPVIEQRLDAKGNIAARNAESRLPGNLDARGPERSGIEREGLRRLSFGCRT